MSSFLRSSAWVSPDKGRFRDGGWTRETSLTDYAADGTRRDISVSEASDHPAVTNSVTLYEFLGRAVVVRTPAFGGGWLTTSNFYYGASSRLLRTTRTGRPATLYQYDALGNQTATALDLDGDGVFTSADLATAAAVTHERQVLDFHVRHGTADRTHITAVERLNKYNTKGLHQ